jgi:hypothetical protein
MIFRLNKQERKANIETVGLNIPPYRWRLPQHQYSCACSHLRSVVYSVCRRSTLHGLHSHLPSRCHCDVVCYDLSSSPEHHKPKGRSREDIKSVLSPDIKRGILVFLNFHCPVPSTELHPSRVTNGKRAPASCVLHVGALWCNSYSALEYLSSQP